MNTYLPPCHEKAGPNPQPLPEVFSRRGWIGVSHALIDDPDLPDAAVMLWATLADMTPDADGLVHVQQHQLGARCSWVRAQGTAERRVRRNAKTLTEAGYLVTKRVQAGDRVTLVRYGVLCKPVPSDGQGGFERLPRAVLDVLSRQANGARLMRCYLRWLMEMNRGTGKGWTTLSTPSFAYRYGQRATVAQAERDALVTLGLLLTHTSAEGVVTVRIPSQALPTAASVTRPGVPSPAREELDVMSAPDSTWCPPVFSPMSNHAGNPDLRGQDSCQAAASLGESAHAPNLIKDDEQVQDCQSDAWEGLDLEVVQTAPVAEQAKFATDWLLQACPQLQGLPALVRIRIGRGMAKAWRRFDDRDVAHTLELLLNELQHAAQNQQLGRGHIHVIRRVLNQWAVDRLVADPDSQDDQPVVVPDGPDLPALAARTLPETGHGLDDAQVVCEQLTTTLAGLVLDELWEIDSLHDPDVLTQALHHSLEQLRPQVADQHQTLLAIAKAQVRQALHVSQARAERDMHTALEQGAPDLELQAIIQGSLAGASQHAGC